PAGQPQQGEGDDGDGQDISAYSEAAGQPPETQPAGHAETDGPFERRPSASQQVITCIALPVRFDTCIALSNGRQGCLGNIELGELRTACQMLDGAAIEIACDEIHAGETIGFA